MPNQQCPAGSLSLLGPPYARFLDHGSHAVERRGPGWVQVWNMGVPGWESDLPIASQRPGGLPLLMILPESARVRSVTQVLRAIERTRPQAVLPYHEYVDAREVALILRRPPASLAASVTEYLVWRGISMDQATLRTIRRTVELSEGVRTITALARNLYVSRRALGRRFLTRSLPVPSHWLHMSRLVRACIRLQNGDDSLFQVACDLGYSDGFALSNQMSRLCGVRPSEARECLGWEWLFEAWLMQEDRSGGFGPRALSRRASIYQGGHVAVRAQAPGSRSAAATM